MPENPFLIDTATLLPVCPLYWESEYYIFPDIKKDTQSHQKLHQNKLVKDIENFLLEGKQNIIVASKSIMRSRPTLNYDENDTLWRGFERYKKVSKDLYALELL